MAQTDILRENRTPERLIPQLSPLYDALTPYSWPLVRFAAGAMLIPHGWDKFVGGSLSGVAGYMSSLGIQPGIFWATYIGLLELVGGTLLVIGLLTRFVAIQVFGFMMVAAFFVHWSNGFMWATGGFEYPLFWGLVARAIAIRGAGPLSVDAAIGKEL